MAFYVMLVGFFMMVGAYVGRHLVKTVTEMTGFALGGVVGVAVSYLMYQVYGKKMIMNSGPTMAMRY